jgi:hypothetical protein
VCNTDTLSHAAGQLCGIGFGEIVESHESDRISKRRAISAASAPARRNPKATLSRTVSQGKLASSWKTTPMPSGTSPTTGLPSKLILPATSQHVQQRGLAAAGWADNREKLAARQIEVERS